MAKLKKAPVVEEAPATVSVGEYVSAAVEKFIAARNALVAANPDDVEIAFIVAAEEAKIAISQSSLLVLSDLQTRIADVLDKAANTIEK